MALIPWRQSLDGGYPQGHAKQELVGGRPRVVSLVDPTEHVRGVDWMHAVSPMVGRRSTIQIRGSTMSMRGRCVKLWVSDCAHVACQGLSTSSDVLNPRTRSLIMQGAEVLQRSPALQALLEDQEFECDLVLDVLGDGAAKTSYYYVSHAERRVFWLEGIGHEEVDVSCTSNKCIKSKGSRVHCSFMSSALSCL